MDDESLVRIGGMYTDWFRCQLGVRQGDNLSPILFPFFIQDLAKGVKRLNKDVSLGGKILVFYHICR